MSTVTTTQIIASIIFALALVHTFSTTFFMYLAHRYPKHAGTYHLLGEVEVVFGFWAGVLFVCTVLIDGGDAARNYINSRNFTEPLFVFVILVLASTRPILQTINWGTLQLSRVIRLPGCISLCFIGLGILPLAGSLITEPAAMTLAALTLAKYVFVHDISLRLKYLTIGALFVNISIGGTLTSFAAPPVLMVANSWGWDNWFMFINFGDKAVLAVLINAAAVVALHWRELAKLPPQVSTEKNSIPATVTALHFLLLVGVVYFAHDPPIFIGLFLAMMGVATAYPQYQDRLLLREGLLVAFFLGGLVVLGGLQAWWLQPLLTSMNADQVFVAAIMLTAITDNAALTYLGSLVPNLSDSFKYALVSGAVTGGGLTVIANAPNPAGMAILRQFFPNESVNAGRLFLAALVPTLVAAAAFYFL